MPVSSPLFGFSALPFAQASGRTASGAAGCCLSSSHQPCVVNQSRRERKRNPAQLCKCLQRRQQCLRAPTSFPNQGHGSSFRNSSIQHNQQSLAARDPHNAKAGCECSQNARVHPNSFYTLTKMHQSLISPSSVSYRAAYAYTCTMSDSPLGKHRSGIHQASQEAKILEILGRCGCKKKGINNGQQGSGCAPQSWSRHLHFIQVVLEKAKLYSFSSHPFSISMRCRQCSFLGANYSENCAPGKPPTLSTVPEHARDR